MNHGDHGRRSHAAERSGADTDRLCISSIRPPLDDQGESSLRVIWARAGMQGEELRNKPHLATPTAGPRNRCSDSVLLLLAVLYLKRSCVAELSERRTEVGTGRR